MNIGRVVAGRYELVERVGAGTFFQVFKGRERVTGSFVAVKALHPEVQADAAFCPALMETMTLATELAHPGIARVYEVTEEDGAPVLITEFVRGMDLKERIRRIAPFTVSVAVDFALAICEALQYAHASGFVHGDLRPQHIIVTPDGVVKVVDFGLAAAIAASPEAAARNLAKAVPYQAPEAAAQGVILQASDIYALGVVLFEMLTGSLPYRADTPVQMVMKHQTEPPPSPREQNQGVPRALDGIVRKAMQKQPADRYASASDMLADLKKVRDALRFGRSVQWSPLEETPVPAQGPSEPRAEAPSERPPDVARRPAPRPVEPEVTMSRREPSNQMPAALRILLMLVGTVVLLLAFLGIGLWLATSTTPEEAVFPDLVGKPIEQARAQAQKLKIQLIEREEYNDQYEPGIVYRVDYEVGRRIRPGRTVLTWISKGSRLVWVPEVTGLSAAEAEVKLKDGGLSLGQVDRRTSSSVPYGVVISQNPRSGKRVERGTPVSVVISDGPSEGEETLPSAEADQSPDAEHLWNVTHRVRRDGRGPRQVRIEFEDNQGSGTAFDEVRNEGDVIQVPVRAQGPTLIVRVYYGDDPVPVSERTVPWRAGR